MQNTKKVLLMILDGWGHGPHNDANAIYKARTPFVDSLYEEYPHAELTTSGEAVGLPEGQMGNSEVGHLNIGAGRIVMQELLKINKAVENRSLHKHAILLEALKYAQENGKAVHFIGLVSDGGVHSHIEHLKALTDLAAKQEQQKVYIHAFTDGRDVDPKSGKGFIRELQDHLKKSTGEIATITGRYYAMDRDKRWQRIKLAYNAMVKGEGKYSTDLVQAVQGSYDAGITDEFIRPIIHTDDDGAPVATIGEGDVVISFNFRTDRCRQIVTALSQQDLPEENMRTLDIYLVTMTRYDENFRNVKVVFNEEDLPMTLGAVLERKGKTQLRIAETEKYPHVSFFFSGGEEKEYKGEKRILIPSPKVATYDQQPEMSAYEVTEALIKEVRENAPDVIILNFANADMVGHTGVFEAGVKAVETVDACAKMVTETAVNHGYALLITADHGNADLMINNDGTPNTAHTTNPVPIFYINRDDDRGIKDGILADLAPTVLDIMNIEQPKEMTGKSLIRK